MLQEKQIRNSSWKILLIIVKYIPGCADSIFPKASSYAFIKAMVLGKRYEEEKAGEYRNSCQDDIAPAYACNGLFYHTRREKTGVGGVFG